MPTRHGGLIVYIFDVCVHLYIYIYTHTDTDACHEAVCSAALWWDVVCLGSVGVSILWHPTNCSLQHCWEVSERARLTITFRNYIPCVCRGWEGMQGTKLNKSVSCWSVYELTLFDTHHIILISAYTDSILHTSCYTDQYINWFYFTYIMLYWSVHKVILFYLHHVILINAYTDSTLPSSHYTDQCIHWFYFTYTMLYWSMHKLILVYLHHVILIST